MRILSQITQNNTQIYNNNFKGTVYEESKITEKDIFSICGKKSIFNNPISPDKEIMGVKLISNGNNSVEMYSRYGNKIGIFNRKPESIQPEVNLQIGNFQPMIEIKDDELGITLLMSRGSKIKGNNFDLETKNLTNNFIHFGHKLVVTTGYLPQKTKNVVEKYRKNNNDIDVDNYYSNKLKNDYTIVGLGGGFGTRLKPISDLGSNNKLSTPYPGNKKTLFEVSVLDSAYKMGNITSVNYIHDDKEKLIGTAGIIIKGIKDGTIKTDKPLVLLTGDTCHNINLAKALYDYEQSADCGIGVIVNKITDAADKSCVDFNYNKFRASHDITGFSDKVNINNADFIKNNFSINVDGNKNYYSSTNAMIISPDILKYLNRFSNSDGSADYMDFFGLMFNVLNKTNENLLYKYPNGLPSQDLKLDDLIDYNNYPKSIKNGAGKNLKVKAIIAKDYNGNDAISDDVGTIEDYFKTSRKIAKNENFDTKLTNSLKNNIDESGLLYYGENSKELLEEFKKKYAINELNGNILVYAHPRPNKPKQEVHNKLSENNLKINKCNSSQDIFLITKYDTFAQSYIDGLMKAPDKLKDEASSMIDRYGLGKFLNWYLSMDGYYGKYEKYVDNLYENADSIDDLLKFTPNWAPWKLEEKAWKLDNPHINSYSKDYIKEQFAIANQWKREYGFSIGKLPVEFNNPTEFNNLVKELKKTCMQNGNTNGFDIERLKGGELNDKFIYKIKKYDKTYILKFDRSNIEDADTINGRHLSIYEKRNIRKNKYLAADSIYSNACISKYLELNGCKNIPKMYYYSQSENAALYEYIEDVNNDLFQNSKLDEEYEGILDTNKKYNSLNKLGIYLNDTALKNTLVDKNGTLKIIDLGHANFIMPFKPGVKHYNIEFSNINGPDYRTMLASILNIL